MRSLKETLVTVAAFGGMSNPSLTILPTDKGYGRKMYFIIKDGTNRMVLTRDDVRRYLKA